MFQNKACTINGKHTYRDYGLYVINNNPVAPPEVRTQYLTIPGRNGDVDLTDALTGGPVYGKRMITLQLNGKKPSADWDGFISDFLNEVHGKLVTVIFDDDPDYFYLGRASVQADYTKGNEVASFTLVVEADPFKRSVDGVTSSWLWDPYSLTDGAVRCYDNMVIHGTADVVKVLGDETGQTPVFYASCPMTMTFGGTTYNLVRGRNYFSGINLASGYNTFAFNGFGTVTIRFGEAIL